MSFWNFVGQLAGILALVRLGCYFNQMLHTRVPQWVILAVLALAVPVFIGVIAPFYAQPHSWKEALLLWGIAIYLWVSRRSPHSRYAGDKK